MSTKPFKVNSGSQVLEEMAQTPPGFFKKAIQEKSKSLDGPEPELSERQRLQNAHAALVSFREGIQGLWEVKSRKDIDHTEPARVSALFAFYFDHAKSRVRIFSNNLAKDIFGSPEVVRAAQAALERGILIDIILQNEPEASGFKDLLDSNRIRFIQSPAVSEFKLNFAVMDDTTFRVQPDREKRDAKLVMHDPENAATLNAYFDTLWIKIESPGAVIEVPKPNPIKSVSAVAAILKVPRRLWKSLTRAGNGKGAAESDPSVQNHSQ